MPLDLLKAKDLRNSKFYQIIDEKNDISIPKICGIECKYLNKYIVRIITQLLDLTEIYDHKCVRCGLTQENLFQLLIKYLTENNGPIENRVCFASNGI